MNVGFVGAGHIARAMAVGWSRPGLDARPRLLFHDVDPARAAETAAASGGQVAMTTVELVAASDVLLVAVRPQHVEPVLAAIGPSLGRRPLVSVAAGVTLARLLAALPRGSRAARVMPNVAAALGLGVFLFVPGTLGDATADVAGLFALAGDVVEVSEPDFDVATAIAGCMPGMLAAIVESYARAGEAHGLAPDVARRLAVDAVHGAAAIIAREGDPAAVTLAAATPGGMTAAGIAALEERGMAAAVHAAVAAAAAQAAKLA